MQEASIYRPHKLAQNGRTNDVSEIVEDG